MVEPMANDPQKAQAKAEKRQLKEQKRVKRKQTRSQLWEVLKLQVKEDKLLIPALLAWLLVPAIVGFLIGLLFGGQWFLLLIGLAVGVFLAFSSFSRRVRATMFSRAEGTPGAAGWTLDNMRNTVGIVWFVKTAVAANQQMDSVHRVVGVPGIVLVAEGNRNATRKMMDRQHRRLDKLMAGVPIYEIYVGTGEDEVPLKKLQRKLLALPRNYRKNDVYPINAKVEAMDSVGNGQAGMPKGPLPKNANFSGMNRRIKRSQQRHR